MIQGLPYYFFVLFKTINSHHGMLGGGWMTSSSIAMDALRFIAAYSGYSGTQPSTSASGAVELATKDGVVAGLATISRLLIGDKLKASSPEAEAQVTLARPARSRPPIVIIPNASQIDEWLTWATTELTPLVDDKLFKVRRRIPCMEDHGAVRTGPCKCREFCGI